MKLSGRILKVINKNSDFVIQLNFLIFSYSFIGKIHQKYTELFRWPDVLKLHVNKWNINLF